MKGQDAEPHPGTTNPPADDPATPSPDPQGNEPTPGPAPSGTSPESAALSGPDPQPAPPNPPPIRLPLTVAGKWRRDWRLGREVVGRGTLRILTDGVLLRGRRTGPIRSLLYLIFRVLLWAGSLVALGVTVLTSVGLAVRTEALEWLLTGPAVGFIAWVIALPIVAGVGRWLLQPSVIAKAPWSALERIASDGKFVEVSLTTQKGRLVGRIKPKRTALNRRMMAAIRSGQLPHGAGTVSTRRLRPVWIDRAVLATLIVGATFGVWRAQGSITTWWEGRHEPSSGPLAGLPDALTPEQLEAKIQGVCLGGDPDAPRVHNRRDGDDLVWSVDRVSADHTVAHLRWRAGTARTELAVTRETTTDERRETGFFSDDQVVALSLVVPRKHLESAKTLLTGQGLESFRMACCTGHVAGFDVTVAEPPAGAPTITAERDGDDLVVRFDPASGAYQVLPVRRRVHTDPAFFDVCETPVEGGRVGLLPARDERRYRSFFHGPDEQARVYLVPVGRAGEVELLGRTDGAPMCMRVDSLHYAGVTTGRALTALERTNPLIASAEAWVRRRPLIPVGGDSRQVIDAITERYEELVVEYRGQARGAGDWASVNQGFLQAIEWTALLDRISFGASLPRLEVMRQRMSGADPNRTAGEQFLLRLADEFLRRIPPDAAQYEDRYRVGQAWLAVEAGTEWRLDGRAVRVPDVATADYYQVVGRFVLIDLGRRLEDALRAGTLARGDVSDLQRLLEDDGIALDIERSSTSKALGAWVTGDFEYLGGRAMAKVQQSLHDEQSALEAASRAQYRLVDQWSGAGGAARYADLRQDGGSLGWVALYDQARVELEYVPVAGHGTTAAALAGGQTLLLATSGSYVTQEGRTSGLAVVDGQVQNFLISPRMDGLVILRGDGTLAVLDMRNGGELPGRSGTLQPLRSLRDFHELLRWLEHDRASAFQTHLLAYDGELTIDEAKAKPDLRERRLLVMARYAGNPIVAVVDIPLSQKQSLFHAAVVTSHALATPNAAGGPELEVEAIANLDVGSFDILHAWSDDGRLQRNGPVGLGEAMNLVTVKLP